MNPLRGAGGMYTDWVRGFCVPLLLVAFGGIALVNAARQGATFAPLLLAVCLVVYGLMRLRHFFTARRAAGEDHREP